ncbi:HAD-IA family hydrolase [Halomonas sp. M4R5S39]|uniref:HAD family hydrolase n=1 Tax=Halomonas kalidii TaxID=3043293 RepID=UPI0024A82110|nr:HAD-IA family hydrolase [Halomonas kalidii]MDI5983397.1 HAD-IA family hydrolase [Halomonas kalidii]
MTIRAILFDHDGTLVDSEPVHFQMWQQILERRGITLSEKMYKACYAGKPTDANAVDMVERFHLSGSHEELVSEKSTATQQRLKCTAFSLRPGVKEVLHYLYQRGVTLGVVTGAGRNGVEATLRDNALHALFSTVVSGDDVNASKPAPDVYLLAMKRLGLAASQCLAIEDTEHGVKAATGAGISCIAIPNDMTFQHDFSKAAAIIDDFDDLLVWLNV